MGAALWRASTLPCDGGKNTKREKRGGQRGGATGGTYCQVGPGGVARVAPLRTARTRGGGQNISSEHQHGKKREDRKRRRRRMRLFL